MTVNFFLLQDPLEVQGITYFGARELYVIMALFCHIVIKMTRARIVDDPRVASQLGTLADNCHIVLVYFSIVSSKSTSNIQNGFILKLKLKSRNKISFFIKTYCSVLIKFNNFHSVTIEQDSIIHQTQIHWSGSFFRRFSKQFFFCQSSKRFHLDFFYFMAAIFSLDHFLNNFNKTRLVINPLFYYKIMKKGIPIRKWRDVFRRGFAIFLVRILKFSADAWTMILWSLSKFELI